MNKEAQCYNETHGHYFLSTGSDCQGCGINQAVLSGAVQKQIRSIADMPNRFVREKPNTHLHSPLHLFIDDLRTEYGENHIKKGVGSFGFYLGLLKNVPHSLMFQWRSEIRDSKAVGDLGKLFVWKVKEWKKGSASNNQ